METFDPIENARKYEDESGKDIIATYATLSTIGTIQACIMLGIAKYAKRYTSDSSKSALESDIKKMQDYARRIQSLLTKLHVNGAKHVIECVNVLYEIKFAIKNSNFVEVQEKCKKLFVLVDELRISATV